MSQKRLFYYCDEIILSLKMNHEIVTKTLERNLIQKGN